jgi:Tfp pilus assembly protein PilP
VNFEVTGANALAAVFILVASAGAQSATAPDRRRDPFLRVSTSSSNPKPVGALKRGDGLAAYTVNEISVRGIMQGGGMLIAIVQGPDKRSYVAHQGDRLADGFVRGVTSQGLVLVRDSSDPESVRQRPEILKLLRSPEDGKE